MPEDEAFLQAALDGVRTLNDRYFTGGPDRFFVFHRRRLWNPTQGCWMGWERKRGKLMEFNRLLRGARDTSYMTSLGRRRSCRRIRYVITLDADTQLPHDAARRLIGTLAHPLNRPVFDAEQGRVVSGYGVLQPRVSSDDDRSPQVAVRAHLRRLRGPRPVYNGRLQRLSRPFRRRRALRAKAFTTWTRSSRPWGIRSPKTTF